MEASVETGEVTVLGVDNRGVSVVESVARASGDLEDFVAHHDAIVVRGVGRSTASLACGESWLSLRWAAPCGGSAS